MAFGDQIYRQKKIITENAMNVKHTLSKYLTQITTTMHKVRRLSLFAAIESTINGGVLSVTGLNRKSAENTENRTGTAEMHW
ncbi:hypothetical protein [Arsukibacterium sp. MJ3]|uniref:hypothetical protein n=1 Tax=Arsukibacterium sp. MJ3 TaxID=1632859 RepID=UPI0006272DF7